MRESTGFLRVVIPQKRNFLYYVSDNWCKCVDFETPFGKRRLTYVDHTASGRCLHYIENYIIDSVLPFYAAYVKKCLGGGEEDAIIFCGSGSTAAIKRLQEVMGISVPSILREEVLTKCFHKETKERWQCHWDLLGYKSHCSSSSQNGAGCFDFAAGAPYAKIEMRSGEIDGYDAVSLALKFLGGPGTPGVLLMKKALYRLRTSPPSTCGGGTVNFVNPLMARGGCACAGPYGHSLLKVDEPHSLAFRDAIKMGYSGVKPGWTRVSFPYYMSKEEFVFILAAVEFISIYGQRFLPLYHFNWRNGVWTFKKKAFNCNFCCSQMTKVLRTGFHDTKENNHGGGSTTKQGLVYKYVKYLETAKRIANLLPKFPPQRPIPEEIDPNLVPFRV
ncbi:hypothetical protein HAX54_025283 [Datura stramonium]|uniref:Uncharacterized protein n=1 Tax=Datura stramonium TaxID=4076 RepID=A0ABS8S676_DATST|nr:hypothetical protein [Datura stramonium]